MIQIDEIRNISVCIFHFSILNIKQSSLSRHPS